MAAELMQCLHSVRALIAIISVAHFGEAKAAQARYLD